MEMELGLETLEQYQTRIKLTEAQCAQIMVGVFSALEYLHDEVNVIHRDLKPENIVIMDYDDLKKVKLIDFGLAVESTKNSIQDFAKCGTLLYTPPEQVLNNFAYAKVSRMANNPDGRKLTCGPQASLPTNSYSASIHCTLTVKSGRKWKRS